MKLPLLCQAVLFACLSLLVSTLTFGENAHHSEISITFTETKRVITANGIPDHKTGKFPGRGNPHTISPQRHRFQVPLNPEPAIEPTPCFKMPFGIATNGVLFDPGTAELWQGKQNWRYEAIGGGKNLGLDHNHAHVQPSGSYHYHGIPTGLLTQKKEMLQLGWAADGYPIYAHWGYKDTNDKDSPLIPLTSGYQLKDGERSAGQGPAGKYDGSFASDYEYNPEKGNLDQFNGRTGVTPEFPEGTFYYVVTEDFPFIPRLFKGPPDPSFTRMRNRRGQRGNHPQRGSGKPGHKHNGSR